MTHILFTNKYNCWQSKTKYTKNIKIKLQNI